MTRQEEGKRGEGGERRGGTERWGRREPERGKTWAGLPAAWGAGREPAGAAPAGVLCATIGRPPRSFPGAPRAGAGLGRKDSPAAVPRGGGGELRGPRPGTATTVRGDTGEAGGVRPITRAPATRARPALRRGQRVAGTSYPIRMPYMARK